MPSLDCARTKYTALVHRGEVRLSNIRIVHPVLLCRVTLCGKVKLVCFDKTGTLTEDSLDLLGLRPVVGGRYRSHDSHMIIT